MSVYKCPTCNFHSNINTHRLSPGLARILIKFRRSIRLKGANSIHLQRDMFGENELTRIEYTNAQKLRFFGLIAKDKDTGRGYWLLTSRGRKWLDGEITVPVRVSTVNNAICARDENHVSIEDVMQTRPVFDDFDYWHQNKAPVPLELAQVELL